MVRKLSRDELETVVEDSFERVMGPAPEGTDPQTSSNEERSASLYAAALAANTPLDRPTLDGEPEGLLRELALELVPEFSANSEPEQLSPYNDEITTLWDDIEVGTGTIPDTESRSGGATSAERTVSTNEASEGAGGGDTDLEDLNVGTGEIDDISE